MHAELPPGIVAGSNQSLVVVLAAMFANAAIAVLKFVGYLLTGSPSMLSETYHSVSDTGNQVLLLVGLQFSKREPTRQHPFGWGKSEFFYGFVVSMILFLLAGWESLREGWREYQEVQAGHNVNVGYGSAEILGTEVSGVAIAYAILGAAFLFELYALSKATRGMRVSMKRGRYANLWETFRKTKAATILTAFTEDILALVGLVVAGTGLGLAVLTGNPIYDAIAAMVIGAMLMAFAVILAWEQKRLLVGEAMEAWQENAIQDIILEQAPVAHVDNIRSVHFGPERVVFGADVIFRPGVSAQEASTVVDEVEATIRERFPQVATIYLEPELPPASGRDR